MGNIILLGMLHLFFLLLITELNTMLASNFYVNGNVKHIPMLEFCKIPAYAGVCGEGKEKCLEPAPLKMSGISRGFPNLQLDWL